ncbi:M1 family aminopeptidase [Arachidicoccus ginsenosidivorans]|uniref:Aminopeptidase N n=1 Tax=Arachidicoccus ginsenosidivorans TaxID=496057 RepID=A0A5B8VI85_9BACT|nr:M1 family aminopeptidase [Arachidicoccus ginsenosidivorans]QEC71200.1 aminopeptidase [Arachidicoccus ginsenosidivorans]
MNKHIALFRNLLLIFFSAWTLLVLNSCHPKGANGENGREVKLTKGVSEQLATYRKTVLSDISYQVDFDIPLSKAEAIQAKSSIYFNYHDSLENPLQIDFKQTGTAALHKMFINGMQTVPNYQKEHIIIDGGQLKKGANQIDFVFQPSEEALNRRADYLYTLFVPDRARSAMPCFDQPDLKAVFKLTLHIDTSWHAIANGRLEATKVLGSRKTLQFAPSDTLSTYLFAFTAGKFTAATGKIDTMTAKFLYRESDPAKIKTSLKEVYRLSDKAIRFYEDWTGIPYPFHNLGMAAIPNFQFGGMEHPGTILYQSSSLFLDPGPTTSQLNNRSNLLAHELAHMWFGDLVTMRWFNDVWMKEVFANFMADKCMRPTGKATAFNHKFLIDHYPAAYDEDRTAGATPIRQNLDNLQNAGMLYGNIIYHKAPIMMRQLELLAGAAGFKKGVRAFLSHYAYGNAGWPELINLIDQQTPVDLQKWNKVWVESAGRPVFDYKLETKNGRISQLILSQHPEKVPGRNEDKEKEDQSSGNAAVGQNKIWPQIFDLTLFYPHGIKVIGVRNSSRQMDVKAAIGQKAPLFILFNSNGMGYGRFPADSVMARHLDLIGTPLQRASAYINLYEQMLAGKKAAGGLTPQFLLRCFLKAAKTEKDELNTRLLLSYIKTIYWDFTAVKTRASFAPQLEAAFWADLVKNKKPNIKKLYFQAYSDIFLSKTALDKLHKIWTSQAPPSGLKLYEDDYTNLALQLALRIQDDQANQSLLDSNLNRMTNKDKKATFKIVMDAASSNKNKRAQFFKEITDENGRSNERAILEGLSYLHHPLRQSESEKYLGASLKLLEEIQRTGTIFFPKGYVSAIFSRYNSSAALEAVNAYLDSQGEKLPQLTNKLLQATDLLRRSHAWLFSDTTIAATER